MEDAMLQRYDISMNVETNCFSIEEFSVIDQVSRNAKDLETNKRNYSLVQKRTYNGDTIRSATKEGKDALISTIRSNHFFPTHYHMDILAESIIKLFENNSTSFSEVFFDDHNQFVHENE